MKAGDKMKQRIFVIDDEEILRVTIADDLTDAGYSVEVFDDPDNLLERLRQQSADVVITDIKMPKMDGLELLRRIKTQYPEISVIVMTAYGSVNSAIEAMKQGAYDYLTKPFTAVELILRLNKIRELSELKKENSQLRDQVTTSYAFRSIVGRGPFVRELYQSIETVAASNTSVLITGETGTGKELIAHVIHHTSARRLKPFIKVSCAILSRDIFESELFGHERGAFTGAIKDKTGKFEMAEGGTIYLDDVDDIPLDLQVKLLRALEEREIEKVGGSTVIKIDVRVLASSKADLRKLVENGKFREDLFYRLNVFPIHLKPLRERQEDIEALFMFFARQFAPGITVSLEPVALEKLKAYPWYGNVRELRNIVERLILLHPDGKIGIRHLPCEINQVTSARALVELGRKPLADLMEEIEMNALKYAVEISSGNKTKAAELLGMPVSTLRTKMEKYQIDL